LAELTLAAPYVRALLELAASKGADRRTLLVQAGLEGSDLEDREARLPFAAYVRLMRAAKAATADPALALHFGEAVDLTELSLVALLGQASESPMEALAQLNRFGRLDVEVASDDRPRFELVQRGGRLWFVDARPDPNAFPEMTESSFARMFSSARRAGFPDMATEVHFTHKAPSYRDEYDRIFRVPVVFGSPWNALALDDRLMTMNFSLQPRYLFDILSEKAAALLGELDRTKAMRGRVEAMLTPLLPGGQARIETVAEQLGMSRQTLYRRLRVEATSFEAVLDDLRRTLALRALDAGKPVAQIAYDLGFADSGAFSRAFKRWTGASPAAWRKSARAE
jgi:AraC-like DNA-binding protein